MSATPHAFDSRRGFCCALLALSPLLSGCGSKSDRAAREMFSLRAHDGLIYSVVYSASGNSLFSSGLDGLIHSWDLDSRTPRLSFKGHRGGVRSIVLSEDGTRMLSGSNDQTLRSWNVATGKETMRIVAHRGSVNAVSFTKSGTCALTSGADQTVRCWDLETKDELWRYSNRLSPPGTIYSLAVSRDGRTVFAGCEDRTIRLLDAHTGEEIDRWRGNPVAVLSLHFSPFGKRLLSSGSGKEILVWDLAEGNFRKIETRHTGSLPSTIFSRDGQSVISASFDGSLRVIEIESGEETAVYPNHDTPAYTVALNPVKGEIASGDYEGVIRVWSLGRDHDPL